MTEMSFTSFLWLGSKFIGEGNGTPLQHSCLENPMDGGAWWAAVHGVTKSRTRLNDFTFTFSLSCIGEGNGNPLQCSCLENPRGRRAWWADIYGVTQSRTPLKWLSSNSSKFVGSHCILFMCILFIQRRFQNCYILVLMHLFIHTCPQSFNKVMLYIRFACWPHWSPCKMGQICCCPSVAQSCLTLCDPMDRSSQASLSFTISWSLLKLMSIESVMPSNHLVFCCSLLCLQSFPASGSFPMSRLFTSDRQICIQLITKRE